jgi:hypothetical protein
MGKTFLTGIGDNVNRTVFGRNLLQNGTRICIGLFVAEGFFDKRRSNQVQIDEDKDQKGETKEKKCPVHGPISSMEKAESARDAWLTYTRQGE